MLLAATRRQQRDQARIREAGLRDIRRASRRGARFAARQVAIYQDRIIGATLAGSSDVLAEQGLSTAQVAAVDTQSLLTGAAAVDMLARAETDAAFDRLVSALLSDAARTAMTVDIATRPAVTGMVRAVTTPCCGRCAVLAGRVYRWNAGFDRHPRCDCIPVGTSAALGKELAVNPDAMFRSGQIRGLSRGDVEALNNGADLGQVVNVRRKAAGLVDGSSVMVRAGRPTPQFLMRVASDRDQALSLLARYRYIT